MSIRTGATPTPRRSASERFVQRKFYVLILYALCLIGGVYAIGVLGQTFGLSRWTRAGFAGIWLVGLPFAWGRLHLPITLRRSHSLVFSATPDVIWQTIVPRETTDYYRASVARIAKISSAPEIYRYTLRDLSPGCLHCGLPHAPSRTRVSYESEVVESIENKLLMTRAVGPIKGQRPVARQDCSLWQIEPYGDGCVVVYSAVTVHPLLWYWASSRLTGSNLAANILSDLQTHLEGTPGTGSFAAAREWLAAARAAPEHCSCDES